MARGKCGICTHWTVANEKAPVEKQERHCTKNPPHPLLVPMPNRISGNVNLNVHWIYPMVKEEMEHGCCEPCGEEEKIFRANWKSRKSPIKVVK